MKEALTDAEAKVNRELFRNYLRTQAMMNISHRCPHCDRWFRTVDDVVDEYAVVK